MSTRSLRTYQHVAHRIHHCDECQRVIESGSLYEGEVSKQKGYGIVVRKRHISPPCEFPTEDDKLYKEMEARRNLENLTLPEPVATSEAA